MVLSEERTIIQRNARKYRRTTIFIAPKHDSDFRYCCTKSKPDLTAVAEPVATPVSTGELKGTHLVLRKAYAFADASIIGTVHR